MREGRKCDTRTYYQDFCWECLGLDSRTSTCLFIYLFIYLLAELALRCCLGFHLVAVSGGYSLVLMRGLLLAVASLEEHRL